MATPLPPLPLVRATTARARQLRRESTQGEDLLWQVLRGGSLPWKFRRQHIIGTFVVDFFCPALRLGVEVDGSVHDEPDQQTRDRLRQDTIEHYGVEFLRVRTEDVERQCGEIVARIAAAAARREECVERDRLWLAVRSLEVGCSICYSARALSATVESITCGSTIQWMYGLSVEEDDSYVTEVCTVRGRS